MIGALLTVAALALTAVVSARLGVLLLPRYAGPASPSHNGEPAAADPPTPPGRDGDARPRHLHSVSYLEAFDRLPPVDDGPDDRYGGW